MIRKLLVIAVVAVIGVFYLGGCKKKPEQPVKTMAEYETDAKEQITKKNMNEELERIEKSVAEDTNQEQ